MPLIGTRGAASAQGFGEFAQSGPATYIEDVFSTYLYTGNGSTQTITNGIDLAGKGGLVWIKHRTSGTRWHILTDSARGFSGGDGYILSTNAANAQFLGGGAVTGFGSTGFSLGTVVEVNQNANTFASWTFRKQPKFFDVLTYTGNGTTQTISHSLGGAVGCVIVKRSTGGADDWYVWHRSSTAGTYLKLNSTNIPSTSSAANIFGNNTTTVDPTSTNFTVGNIAGVNASGSTYVAYLFAHDAGGFGTAGTDNVISCGTFTGQTTVTLGWEPQWILRKRTDVAGDWFIHDTMRGFPVNNSGGTAETAYLNPNLSDAENTTTNRIFPSATGFTTGSGLAGETYIYIAIRRGPMKTPTSGTSVLALNTRTGNGSTSTVSNLSFPPDLVWTDTRSNDEGAYMFDRLRGRLLGLRNFGPDSEVSDPQYLQTFGQTGFTYGSNGSINLNARTYIDWCMRRAPSFFDVVCYTGTGVTNRSVTHNLTVAPELLFVKARNNPQNWSALCTLNSGLQGRLNTTAALSAPSAAVFGNGSVYVAPTGSVFTVGTDVETNASTVLYAAYLFASCPGVSKVGSYSGTGGTQTISCGFAARYVLIKRTDSTGNWWVWDTGRGMVAGTDPRLPINAALGETNANWVYTNASGFQIVTTDATVNASGGTYIYLAIA